MISLSIVLLFGLSPLTSLAAEAPTAVIKAKYVLNGPYVPDYIGKQTVFTRADRRTIHNQTKFDSFLMRWADSDRSDIFRMDEQKMYMVDHEQKSYLECPLAGCANQSIMDRIKTAGKKSEDEEGYESYEERGCQMELVDNKFDVAATGNSRQFGGLDANEYTVDWEVTFKDERGKQDMNRLHFVLWTTTPTADMNTAWKIHRQATDNFLKAKGNDPLLRLLGEDGFTAISAFTGDIEHSNEQQYNAFKKKLASIKGYPLSIKAEWFQKLGGTCKVKSAPEEKTAEKQKSDSTDLTGMATNMLGSFLEKKKKAMVAEWDKEPRIRYIYEVKSVSEKTVKDKVFEVPAKYKLEDRQ